MRLTMLKGKENVAFIVTKVPTADVRVRTQMIKDTQPTLISNIGLLLLVDSVTSVEEIGKHSVDELQDFLARHVDVDRRPDADVETLFQYLNGIGIGIVALLLVLLLGIRGYYNMNNNNVSLLQNQAIELYEKSNSKLNASMEYLTRNMSDIGKQLNSCDQTVNEQNEKINMIQSQVTDVYGIVNESIREQKETNIRLENNIINNSKTMENNLRTQVASDSKILNSTLKMILTTVESGIGKVNDVVKKQFSHYKEMILGQLNTTERNINAHVNKTLKDQYHQHEEGIKELVKTAERNVLTHVDDVIREQYQQHEAMIKELITTMERNLMAHIDTVVKQQTPNVCLSDDTIKSDNTNPDKINTKNRNTAIAERKKTNWFGWYY
ncbi:uncharacterized protein [Antedon mediterranea]|uniref:uncharacterized protein isoform X2 n=1 Tax=Antedon mediterranea TaxID=105859 RepID=UPI003AF72DA9